MKNKNTQIKKYIIIFGSLLILMCLAFFDYKSDLVQDKEQNYVPDIEYTKLDYSNFDKDSLSDGFEEIDFNSLNNDTSVFTITKGNYILSGDFEGNIIVDAKDEKIHLAFNNFHIKSIDGPAIIVKDCDKIVITLNDGTNNIVEDNGDYRMYDEYDACIDSTPSLTINGNGSLIINGYYKDGVHSKDVIKIIDANIETKVKRNSFQGNDGIRITSATMFIQSEKNGFKTTKSDLLDRGYIVVEDSMISAISGRVTFISKSNLYIKNSSITHRSVVELYEAEGDVFIEEGSLK